MAQERHDDRARPDDGGWGTNWFQDDYIAPGQRRRGYPPEDPEDDCWDKHFAE